VERSRDQNSASCSNACRPCIARLARNAALMAPADVPTSTWNGKVRAAAGWACSKRAIALSTPTW
jgi:hypothetical protein